MFPRVRQPNKQRFGIVIRLFFVMGIPWTVDCVSGFLEFNDDHIVVFVFDVINALQGLIIFFLFTLTYGTIKSFKIMWLQLKAKFKVKRDKETSLLLLGN